MDMIYIKCYECDQMLPEENFCYDKSRKYGRSNCCRTCSAKRKKIYYIKNYDIIRQKQREWKKNNRDKVNRTTKKKRDSDSSVKLKDNLRRRLRLAIDRQNGKKNSGTMDYLGCSIQECMQYLESKFEPGMSWENHGITGWHIDHVIPCSSFDLTKEEEIRKCFHYTNLQPLWVMENLTKGSKILDNK